MHFECNFRQRDLRNRPDGPIDWDISCVRQSHSAKVLNDRSFLVPRRTLRVPGAVSVAFSEANPRPDCRVTCFRLAVRGAKQLGRDGGEPEVCLDRIPSLGRVGEQVDVHLVGTAFSALMP